jgi:hypothetical protein
MSDYEFQESIKNILSNRTYNNLPKPAEILEYSRPDVESIATLAFLDIERAISKAGAYMSITFEDNVINSVIEALGGWIYLCRLNVDEMKWIKKEVVRLYGIYSKRAEHPKHLIGLGEQSNGFANKIGNVKASYVIPKREIVPALNSPKTSEMIKNLTELKRIR